MYRQWVPCERNSSYNFIPIFLKFCTCFLHGLKMCICFGYNPCIYFCYFFHFENFVIFWPQILWKCCDSGYLVSATPHTILYWSFWNFVHVFAMVWRCAYGLDIILELIFVIFLKLCTCFLHGLKMCICFGYNPCIYFCYFFHFENFVIFWPQILWKCCDSGYLVSATPHTILYWSFWNFVHVFAMVWRCAYGLDIILELIFVTFSTLWTLSFLTSDCMKVYRQWLPWKSRDSGYLVSATPHTILYRSLWNFAHVFAMVWRCARGLDIILELIFVAFSTLWTLSFLTSECMKVYRQWLPCKRNSLYSFMPVFMQLCTSFFPWFEDVHVVWI